MIRRNVERILARAANQCAGPGSDSQRIITGPGNQQILPVAGDDRRAGRRCPDGVVSIAGLDVAGAVDGVISIADGDGVITTRGLDQIVAVECVDRGRELDGRVDVDKIVARSAGDADRLHARNRRLQDMPVDISVIGAAAGPRSTVRLLPALESPVRFNTPLMSVTDDINTRLSSFCTMQAGGFAAGPTRRTMPRSWRTSCCHCGRRTSQRDAKRPTAFRSPRRIRRAWRRTDNTRARNLFCEAKSIISPLTYQKQTSQREALTTHFAMDGTQIRKRVKRFNPETTKKQKKLSASFSNPSGAL